MCLRTVDTKPKRRKGTGYKAFDERSGELYPVYQYLVGKNRLQLVAYPEGSWYKDTKNRHIRCDGGGHYSGGIHIFALRRDAMLWASEHSNANRGLIVRRVQFSDVVATGTQVIASYGHKAIVARRILIEER